MRAVRRIESRWIRRFGRWVMTAAVGAALLTTGCEGLPPFFAFFLGGFSRPSKTAGKKGPQDYYLGFRAGRKAPDGGGVAIKPPRDLWPPFCVEIRAGLPDVSKTDAIGGGFFCLTLSEPGVDPVPFYGLCALPTNGGLLAFASRTAGNGGQRFFAGASFVDFQFETEGDDIVCRARKAGDAVYVELDRFAIENPGVPLHAGFGMQRVNAGALVGFDLFRVKQNGELPGDANLLEELVRVVFDGTDPAQEALYTADDSDPDLVAATAHLDDAIAQIDEALSGIELVEALPTKKKKPKTPYQLATKSLVKARNLYRKARNKTSKGRFNKGVAKKILSGVRAHQEAGATLWELTQP